MVNFGWSPMKYCGALVSPLTASVESGQSSPSLSTGGGCTAAVGVGVSGFWPCAGGTAGAGPSGPGGAGACGAGDPGLLCAEFGLSALAGLAPALCPMKAMTAAATIPITTTAMPTARPLRRQ
ncbi:hypothetical protein MAHJHV45_31480 [Mycobacterium avium subsp. hominissuis]